MNAAGALARAVLVALFAASTHSGVEAPARGLARIAANPSWALSGGTVFLDLGESDPAALVASGGAPSGEWYELSPVIAEYDNRARPRDPFDFRLAKIEYEARALGVRERILDLRALDAREGGEPGTRYYAYSSGPPAVEPTEKALHKAYSGLIAQVARRRGDGFLSYLDELSGTPFVWAPAVVDGYLQSEERVCSDCASFVAYGMRRLGLNADPRGPEELRACLGAPIAQGLAYDARTRRVVDGTGGSVASPPVASILHFGGHVAVFVEDRAPLGVLDGEDAMYQSLGVTPRRVELGSIPYLNESITLYPPPGSGIR